MKVEDEASKAEAKTNGEKTNTDDEAGGKKPAKRASDCLMGILSVAEVVDKEDGETDEKSQDGQSEGVEKGVLDTEEKEKSTDVPEPKPPSPAAAKPEDVEMKDRSDEVSKVGEEEGDGKKQPEENSSPKESEKPTKEKKRKRSYSGNLQALAQSNALATNKLCCRK